MAIAPKKHMQDPDSDELLDPTKSPTQPPNTCWTWHTVDSSIATIAAKWQTPEGTQPEPAGTAHLERFWSEKSNSMRFHTCCCFKTYTDTADGFRGFQVIEKWSTKKQHEIDETNSGWHSSPSGRRDCLTCPRLNWVRALAHFSPPQSKILWKCVEKKTTEMAISFSNFNIKKHQRYTEATDTDKASIVDETFFGTASQFLSGTAKSLNSWSHCIDVMCVLCLKVYGPL